MKRNWYIDLKKTSATHGSVARRLSKTTPTPPLQNGESLFPFLNVSGGPGFYLGVGYFVCILNP